MLPVGLIISTVWLPSNLVNAASVYRLVNEYSVACDVNDDCHAILSDCTEYASMPPKS